MRDYIYQLLLVDDDPLVHQSLKLILPAHWRCVSVQNFEDINYVHPYHAAFIDLHLDKNSKDPVGIAVIKKLAEKNPHLVLYGISGDLALELMEKVLSVGGQRFLAKPLNKQEILEQLNKIEALVQLRKMSQTDVGQGYIGTSKLAENVRTQIAALKGEPGPILIEGESGTGKEVTTHLLHQQEGGIGPLISVNMASLPENLFESELFGHLKGAFTGADQNKLGLIEAAAGGTLFLDEIEALPLLQQAKLLRFLESGEIKKVGAKETQKIDCRVIVASNRPLTEMVKSKEFREDLYFRISAKRIHLPPLRERKEDIPVLADFFLKSQRGHRNKQFTADGLSTLQNHLWPGNVRELKRICEQLSLYSRLPLIRGTDVEQILQMGRTQSPALLSSGEIDLTLGFNELMQRYEKEVITFALTKFADVDATAEGMGVSRSTLYKKIKDYKIET